MFTPYVIIFNERKAFLNETRKKLAQIECRISSAKGSELENLINEKHQLEKEIRDNELYDKYELNCISDSNEYYGYGPYVDNERPDHI